MVRLNARLAARAEEGFQSLVAKGLDHGNIVSCNVTAINMKQYPLSSMGPHSFHYAQGTRFVRGLVRHAGLLQNQGVNFRVPLAQQIERTKPSVPPLPNRAISYLLG